MILPNGRRGRERQKQEITMNASYVARRKILKPTTSLSCPAVVRMTLIICKRFASPATRQKLTRTAARLESGEINKWTDNGAESCKKEGLGLEFKGDGD